ncbi:MAG: radical SAM/SPASM domain-containing protein [Pseudomonadales bacterium]
MDISINVDIEATNRCNAVCHFCPRDATPHQGHMSMDVFDQALMRTVELRENNRLRHNATSRIEPNICGLGEPLLNPNTPEFIRKVRTAGFDSCSMATNGALLDQGRGTAILEAGVTRVNVNISDLGKDYEDIYNLPYENTRDNIINFIKMSGDRCEVHIVLVNHNQDTAHTAAMKEFWLGYGVDGFMEYDVINRGGALFVDHMQYEQYEERRRAEEIMANTGADWLCPVPFLFVFIGYDGFYYLCCSDWKKEAPMASVFETSLLSITEQKLKHVRTRQPICESCNHDPLNYATDLIRAVSAGEKEQAELDSMVQQFEQEGRTIAGVSSQVAEFVSQVKTEKLEKRGKRLIPVIAV